MFLTVAVLSNASASCPLERARYVLRDAPGFTAEFRPVAISSDWSAGVALIVRSKASGRTYDFLPYLGNGVGTLGHLASTYDVARPDWAPPGPDDDKARPLGDLDFMVLDATYGVAPEPALRRGAPAPAHLLIPGLEEAFWYRTPPDARESAPTAFFDLVDC
ncbi:hypothetical protein [Caulobacter sp. BK020]|uniref:hypothetical protein n=1 Tax=Caulobacter sp. BK020 TaxID=2512117 RepID=UPI0010492B66|nr:hypothetical protein [Caulobacter sp. BK020]